MATIDFDRPLARRIAASCHGSDWFNEFIRTAFQFTNVARVRVLLGGKCDTSPFEGDPRPCTGFVRKAFEHPDSWGPIPRVAILPPPEEDEIVFYYVNCLYRFHSYRVRKVPSAAHTDAVMTAAVNALLRYWYRSQPRLAARSDRWVDVSLSEGIAILDWQSLRHLGWASTTTGGCNFGGSLSRTALQFETVEAVQFHYQGSCARFSAWAQGSGCRGVRLNEDGELEAVEA